MRLMLLFNLLHEVRAANSRTFVSAVLFSTLLALTGAANATLPEQFQRFDPESENTINYGVLTQWLKKVVMEPNGRFEIALRCCSNCEV